MIFKKIFYEIKYAVKRTKRAGRRLFASRLLVLLIVFCMSSSVLIGRLFYLQIIKGEEYAEQYELQIRKTEEISAIRGCIYDRNGNLLAYDDLAYSVTIEDTTSSSLSVAEKNETLNSTLEKLIEIVESNGDSIIDTFGISLDADGSYQFTQTNETQRLRFVADVYGYSSTDDLSDEQKNQTAEELIHYLCTDETYGYGLDEDELEPEYILKMINMRYAMRLNNYQKYVSATVASDVSAETVAAVMENKDTLTGVDVEEDSVRKYVDSEYFSSIIGYTGQISQEEYEALDEEEKENCSMTDIVGKTGLEQVFDSTLRGVKGETTFYVDNVGNVTDTVSTTEAQAGNDIYLTIDSDLQKYTYRLIEEKLAGIILSKLTNVLEYDPSAEEDTSDIKIPVGDAYYSFIGNWILDYTEFSENDAGTAEQTILGLFTAGKEAAVSEILEQLNSSSASAYEDLSSDMQEYMDYVAADVLEENGILSADDADESDETYAAWTEGSISLYEYLLIYDGLIHDGTISGALLCAAAYEQGVLEMNEELYNGLLSGTVSAYEWLCDRIENLEITPGQLALEPCSAGAVVTDPQTGEVLACVSYPGYDSNRLANTMDTEYYSHLVSGMNNIFYNHATQEKTAPGSTYKMVTAVAGLTEGVISSGSTIYCSGTFTKVTPSPNCWIYPGAHGSLSVVGALRESCNDFFYETGYRLGTDENGTYDSDLGIEALAKYARMFGLGETSGIEITEAEPEISDEYAVQSAIGQGTNNYTVSQLCRYVSAVANRGTVYDLSLIDKTTASDGTLIKDYGSETVSQMSEISSETWDLVQTGMEQMVSASSTFDGIDFSMAGKTGTAQQSEIHPDHTLFVGYAPTDNPEIAVAVRIVNGYSSSYAAEIGRDIAKIWFDPDAAAEVLTGTAADLGGAIAGD